MSRLAAFLLNFIVASVAHELAAAEEDSGKDIACTVDTGASLIVTPGSIRALCAGDYYFKDLEIGEKSELLLKGSVEIIADTLATGRGARIVYQSDLTKPEQHDRISLSVDDATQVSSLLIGADGENASDYEGNERKATRGAAGRDANCKHGADMGGQGAQGKKGRRGTNAANVNLTLPQLRAGATIDISAIGGDGGRGQDGGDGGPGGKGACFHPGHDGGYGGNAGDGGDAGDSGRLHFFVVVPDDAQATDPQELLKIFTIRPTYGAGVPGNAGRPGKGANGGKSQIAIGPSAGNRNPDGAAGQMGQPGEQPKKALSGFDGNFAVAEIIPASTFTAQMMSKKKLHSESELQ